MTPILGCIADDFTGATDLASVLVGEGMRTVQLIDVPEAGTSVPEADAIVVALKSRTIEPADAVRQSLKVLAWLRVAGCRQFYFKYCSTFDSTDHGNIGPVAEALMQTLEAPFTIACPALPVNGRTVIHGHLFVGDALLNESGMQDHPLTPMTDANLVRVLQRQVGGKVVLVPYATARQGAATIERAFGALQEAGMSIAIVDALTEGHLRAIGQACNGLSLVTGGSGAAFGLPDSYRAAGLLPEGLKADVLNPVDGLQAVVSGSCSAATRKQVSAMRERRPAFRVDTVALADGADVASEALDWARSHLADGPVLVYATAEPDEVRVAQEKIGRDKAGSIVEEALARIGAGLVEAGVRRLVVAGGETSGAVVKLLGVSGLRIGPEIDPGVPWTESLGEDSLHLALKSGNFGA